VTGAHGFFPHERKHEHLDVDRNLGRPDFVHDVEYGKTARLLIDGRGKA
jgi:hypothetical protein